MLRLYSNQDHVVQQRKRHVDPWNRIETPEISLHKYTQLVLNRDAKAIQWRKASSFRKCCWSIGDPQVKMNLNLNLMPSTKVNSEWIMDGIVKYKTTKPLEDNIGGNLKDLGHGEEFLDMTRKAYYKRKS